MKKIKFFLLISFAVFLFNNCTKEPIYLGPLQIRTDKDNYSIDDKIVVEFKNYTDTIAMPYYHNTEASTIWRYGEESWIAHASNYCLECMANYGDELQPGSSKKDTLSYNFEKGIYRIEYKFSMGGPPPRYRSFYSNIFIVE